MLLTAGDVVSRLLDMTIDDEQRSALEQATAQADDARIALESAKAARENLIQQVALSGASYREIADAAGISHQRVHQLLTGEKPPQMPWQIHEMFRCPRCDAKPGQKCVKASGTAHIQRHNRAQRVFFEGHEPRADEPGPHTALYHAMESMAIGFRDKGPIYLNRDDAEAYARTLSPGSFVARWTGRKWERADG